MSVRITAWLCASLISIGCGGSKPPSVESSATSGTSSGGAGAHSGGAPVVIGWTELEMQPGAMVIHVSSSGDDANPGTVERPKATLQSAYEAVRDGEADWVLLKRGDTWTQNGGEFIWAKSGPIADGAGWMHLGAYGDERLPRPRIHSGTGNALAITPGYRAARPLWHVAVTDIHLIAQGRIEAGASAPDHGFGVHILAVEYQGSDNPINSVLLENLKIEGYAGGVISYENSHDLRVRRCIFTEIFIPGGDGTRATGLLASGSDLLFEDNVFYRIQHPDMPGVTEISTQSHSAYIAAEARNVVSRGNIIIKTTEGFMQRAGGVYERNISAFNEIAHLTGQAWGVTPKAGGVTATVHDNLFLNASSNLILGNTASGSVLRNLLLRGPEGSTSIGIDLIPENAQGNGLNVGVHDTRFEGNILSGDIAYDMSNPQSFRGSSLSDNRTAVGPVETSVAGFLTSVGLSGNIDDYGRDLIARDRGNFAERHSSSAMINFYRTAQGVPALQ